MPSPAALEALEGEMLALRVMGGEVLMDETS